MLLKPQVFLTSFLSLRFFFSAGHQRGSFLYLKVLVAATTFNFTVKQFLLECPFLTESSYEVCTELLSRPEISGCAYVSALTLTIYFLRHFTGSNIVVIDQRKTCHYSTRRNEIPPG